MNLQTHSSLGRAERWENPGSANQRDSFKMTKEQKVPESIPSLQLRITEQRLAEHVRI